MDFLNDAWGHAWGHFQAGWDWWHSEGPGSPGPSLPPGPGYQPEVTPSEAMPLFQITLIGGVILLGALFLFRR